MDSTAIEHLAQARYEQLTFSMDKNKRNIIAVLTNLAIAEKKLEGNSKILEYVEQHYPADLETYHDLLNTL